MSDITWADREDTIPADPDVPTNITAEIFNIIKSAVNSKLDQEKLAADLGVACILAIDSLGSLYGIPFVPASIATAAERILGVDDGDLLWSAKGDADAATPLALSSSSGAIAIDFTNTVVRTTTLTENITSISVVDFPSHIAGQWRVKGHASNSYTITFPTGGVWAILGTSITVPANQRVHFSFTKDGSVFVVFYSDLLPVLA